MLLLIFLLKTLGSKEKVSFRNTAVISPLEAGPNCTKLNCAVSPDKNVNVKTRIQYVFEASGMWAIGLSQSIVSHMESFNTFGAILYRWT